MSASLMVLIPLVLLGLVSTLCFVGCALIYDYSGYTFQSEYQGKVVNDPNLIAFWPLNDQTEAPIDPNGVPALDIGPHKINGVYNSPTTGAVKLNQPQIVSRRRNECLRLLQRWFRPGRVRQPSQSGVVLGRGLGSAGVEAR